MTIYDISEKAGVSIATVSRVLNGNANVKPKTKKKVMDVIEEYGYTPAMILPPRNPLWSCYCPSVLTV